MKRRPPPSIAADHARSLITLMQIASVNEAPGTCIVQKLDRGPETLGVVLLRTLLSQRT